jgi:hypothetical protein
MTRQTSDKRGLRSGAQKQTASRHDIGPMPATQPVPGAIGKQRQDVHGRPSRLAGLPGPPAQSEREMPFVSIDLVTALGTASHARSALATRSVRSPRGGADVSPKTYSTAERHVTIRAGGGSSRPAAAARDVSVGKVGAAQGCRAATWTLTGSERELSAKRPSAVRSTPDQSVVDELGEALGVPRAPRGSPLRRFPSGATSEGTGRKVDHLETRR